MNQEIQYTTRECKVCSAVKDRWGSEYYKPRTFMILDDGHAICINCGYRIKYDAQLNKDGGKYGYN